jgi:flagellar basal body-associated protein FliL
MDRPEEKQESLQGDDHGEGSADPASAGGTELKIKTEKSPDPETLWEGAPQGDSVPEATIIPEDATPPKGPSEAEKNLEESKPLAEGSIEIEAESASDHVSLPEAVEKGPGPGVFRWLKNHQKAVGSVFIGLCVLFLVYGLGRLLTCRHGKHQGMPSVQVYWSPVEKGASDILNFDRFLVLLPKTDEATYLLLKISVKASNPAVVEEMDEKRTFCRASIYVALNKEVHSNKGQRISMKTLKPDIMEALNSALMTGTIATIYFTEFLVV